ncbi:MAG: hypothetical protein IJK31_08100 [Ruminococcus sp.]|nr:hypothetical protein [Ruminococcus sp.]
MAIRKDLDDMLNSLKISGDSPAEAGHTDVHKKSIYDDMSVDDLLNALTEEKRPSLAEDILNELDAAEAVSEAAFQQEAKKYETVTEPEPQPEQPKKKKIVISGELPDYEELRRQEMEKTMLERRKAEDHLSEMNRLAAEAHEAIRQKNERYSHEPVIPAQPVIPVQPVRTELTEELIVNSSSLMDGDTTVFDPPAQETAAPKPDLVPEKEYIPETPVYGEPEPVPVEESIPEPEAVPEPEKPKKGFFSKLRSRMSTADDEINEAAKEVPEISGGAEETDEISEDEAVMVDDLFNENEPEDEAVPEAYEEEVPVPEPEAPAEETEETSAEALIDAAIAAINQAAYDEPELFDEENDEVSVDDIYEDETADEEETSEPGTDDDEGEDRVNSLIDGIREDAANAIADLDKPKEEEPEENEAADEKTAEPEKAPEEEPAKKQGKVAAALENILNEDPDELIAERSEHSETDDPAEAEAVQKKSFKKRLYTVLGVVFALFAVIGIITVAGKGIKMIRSFTSGEVKKDGFTEVIYPAVIMDIDSFDSPSELSSEQLITAAIWSIIMDEDKVSKYTPNAGGDTISISAYDVEAEAVELFGEDHQPFEHTTVGRVEPKFFYDSETGAYNVKLKPIIFTYEPEIKSIVKSGDSYTVSVDYLDELPSWMEKTVAKSVEFHLTGRDDGTYRIDSMNINYVNNAH